MNKKDVLLLLKANVIPALGCTDPITPALAAATLLDAMEIEIDEIKSINLIVSNDIYKGAYSVTIPGTNKKGLEYAVALGLICGKPDKGLMVLAGCTEDHTSSAEEIIDLIVVTPDPLRADISIDLEIKTTKGCGSIVFQGNHEKYKEMVVAGKKIVGKYLASTENDQYIGLEAIAMSDLVEIVIDLQSEDLDFIRSGIETTRRATKVGLSKRYGNSVGLSLRNAFDSLPHNEGVLIKVNTAAAGDARMGGADVPLISVFGSGNQGALIFGAIGTLGELRDASTIEIEKAIFLSCLLAGVINTALKEGTPFCDCALVAAVAASSGIVYLLGGDSMQMENAAQAAISSMVGLICDGAKNNCADRISLGAGVAYESALLSLQNCEPISTDGILGSTYVESINNVQKIGSKVKTDVESCVVDIIKGE